LQQKEERETKVDLIRKKGKQKEREEGENRTIKGDASILSVEEGGRSNPS